MMRSILVGIVAVVVPCGGASAIEFVVLSTPPTDDLLYRLDRDTVQSTQIGSFGGTYDDVANLAVDANGFGYTADRATDQLVKLNVNQASIISAVQLDANVTHHGRGLDFSPQGVLYGVFAGPQLRTIDPVTGDTTFIANIALGMIEAVAFSPDGTLYAVGHYSTIAESDRLYTIDLVTGAHTFIAAMPVADTDALTFAPDGYLYGADATTSPATLRRIDPVTGAITNLGSSGIIHFNGMAVPEPATLCLLAVGALALMRRRKRAVSDNL